ncbi:DUF192 domain-containing protein [Candidatus Woesearchaeota archaeon]|nr:DUF192 domain-containing protein [Candidatus Woesearchaeota archaeon]
MTTKTAIINKTRKTTVAKGYRLCRSTASKAKGLMFTNEAEVRKNALLFEFSSPRVQSLHMFFVFYPIDVLFLDEKKQVVDIKEGFRPFSVYNSSKRSKYVIELPNSAIRKSRTKQGDALEW